MYIHIFISQTLYNTPLFGCQEDELTHPEMPGVTKVISSFDWFAGYSYYFVIVLLGRPDTKVLHVKLIYCVPSHVSYTVKHVCNDHPYNKIYYLWFTQ